MTTFKVTGPDPNVNEICNEFELRACHGFDKYGVTTQRTDLDLMQWIQHLKEELMDAILYLEKIESMFKLNENTKKETS